MLNLLRLHLLLILLKKARSQLPFFQRCGAVRMCAVRNVICQVLLFEKYVKNNARGPEWIC